MAELVKFEVIDFPATKLIGKEIRYSMAAHMQGDNRIPALWEKCFTDGTFTWLEAQKDFVHDPAYVDVMTDWGKGDGDFTTIVGMLMKDGATVPEGYIRRDLPACKAVVSWIKGNAPAELYAAAHPLTEQKLRAEGYTNDKMTWCMELYNCPRFTTPDESGNIILDYYIPLD